MDLGSGEILLILLFALLLYGGRLPEVARSVGRSVGALKRSFQESSASVTEGLNAAMDDANVDGDAPERPRSVRRIQPAPAALATEDITAPDAGAGAAPDASGDGDGGGAPSSSHPPA